VKEQWLSCLSFLFVLLFLVPVVHSEPPDIRLEAKLLKSYSASQAHQGAAVDAVNFYAIDNARIGRYDKKSGRLTAEWKRKRPNGIRHLNSCFADPETGRLYCANSNYPEVPMASSIEIFETETMAHAGTRSLGLTEGSLVWFDRVNDGWLAGFAHYDGKGGIEDKTHRWTRVVLFGQNWQEAESWMLPDSVLDRLMPYSASGGGVGPDGLLYLTGHDQTEMYVLSKPESGPKLKHVATVEINLQGQAFSWDRSTEKRLVWGISRRKKEIRSLRIPPIPTRDLRTFD